MKWMMMFGWEAAAQSEEVRARRQRRRERVRIPPKRDSCGKVTGAINRILRAMRSGQNEPPKSVRLCLINSDKFLESMPLR